MSDAEPSPEEMERMIAGLTEAVKTWRTQENILAAAYTLYAYYYLTTLSEEVLRTPSCDPAGRAILEQKLRLGKLLFTTLRYATLVLIVMYLIRDFRSYLTISPERCKLLLIIGEDTLKGVTLILSDVAFGLCLCALLGAKHISFLLIMLVCASVPIVTFVFHVTGNAELPPLPLDPLSEELGYPCYLNSNEDFLNTTAGKGRIARSYVNFGRTTLLMLLAIATMVMRYRKHSGQLIHILRRDGGIYYITVAATRLVAAIVTTPTVIPVEKLTQSPAATVVAALQEIIVPMLAQRLLLNIRAVDYMGSRPLASTLLFAPEKGETDMMDESETYDMALQGTKPSTEGKMKEKEVEPEPNA